MIQKNIQTIALFWSALIFLFIYGYKIVDPSHIDWIMAGDPGQHFLGWHFFRTEPWHFPLGVIDKYHAPSGTCMVYMDAIPLIGIPLKLFNELLPQPFQYIGLWLLGSYMLQGFFAALLLKKFTDDWRLILLGVTFFILSPIMFGRAGGHEALAGHWLILVALYLYLSPPSSTTRVKWILLILMTSMVHFYLLVMVLAIWAGYVLKELLAGLNKKYISMYFLITMILLLLNMWIIGYFTIAVSNAGTGGFGFYSMNILAPFNPEGGGETTFLNKIKFATNGQYEGYNYLGFGVFILMLLSLFKLPKAIRESEIKILLPITIIMVILFIYSLSGKVTLGTEVLFEFKYLWILKELGDILRASGRIFWPVYYTLIITSIFIVVKYYKPKMALTFLSVALLFQIIDFYPWYSNRNLNNRTFESTLKSEDWQKIASSVKHIVMIPPSAQSDSKNNFALYAANNKIDINIGYVAREDTDKRSIYTQKLMKKFENKKLEKNTLYVVNKKNLIIPSKENKKRYLFGTLDNYHIIIPKNIKLDLGNWFNLNKITSEKILFNSKKVIFDSWSQSEKSHRWSLDNTSSIYCKLDETTLYQGKLHLHFGTLEKQRIIVYINGSKIGDKQFNSWDTHTNFDFNPNILKTDAINIITFKLPNAHKPNNGDNRILAIALKSFSLK